MTYEDKWVNFLYNYKAAAEIVPKDWTIVDLGCGVAFQCGLFKDHARYFGIDNYDIFSRQLDGEWITERCATQNTIHARMNIAKFMTDYSLKLPEKTFYIASEVPAFDEIKVAMNYAEHIVVFYRGRQTMAKGLGFEVKKEREKYDSVETRE